MTPCGTSASQNVYISGNSTHPKFYIKKMCFKVICASFIEYGTRAPESETICEIVDGEQRCTQNAFFAEAGEVSSLTPDEMVTLI